MPVACRICESRSWVMQHVFHQSIGEHVVVGVQHGCSSFGIQENLESWHSPHATKSEGVSVSSVHWVGLETEVRPFLCFVPLLSILPVDWAFSPCLLALQRGLWGLVPVPINPLGSGSLWQGEDFKEMRDLLFLSVYWGAWMVMVLRLRMFGVDVGWGRRGLSGG